MSTWFGINLPAPPKLWSLSFLASRPHLIVPFRFQPSLQWNGHALAQSP
jgi:hypothetical protein